MGKQRHQLIEFHLKKNIYYAVKFDHVSIVFVHIFFDNIQMILQEIAPNIYIYLTKI